MAHTTASPPGISRRWRLFGWGGAIALLAAPLVAMRFTDQVAWSPGDFALAAAMFAVFGAALEWAARSSRDALYRAGAVLALVSSFLVVWANLAVGIVGNEREAVNLAFLVAPAVALAGSVLARFRASGMVFAMLAATFAQLLAGAWVRDVAPGSVTMAVLVVCAPLLVAAALFRSAARRQAISPAAPR